MRVKSVIIRRRDSWEPNAGELTGTVGFESPIGEVSIVLDEPACNKILAVCSESLVRVTSEAATIMAGEIVQALPSPTSDLSGRDLDSSCGE